MNKKRPWSSLLPNEKFDQLHIPFVFVVGGLDRTEERKMKERGRQTPQSATKLTTKCDFQYYVKRCFVIIPKLYRYLHNTIRF